MKVKVVSYARNYKEIIAEWDKYKDWKQDNRGYFLIKLDRKANKIDVGFCKERNVISMKITGKTPQEIYHTIIKKNLINKLEHAAYLGKELHKAHVALQLNIEYVQDDELDFRKRI